MHRRYEFEEDDKEWEWDEEEDDEEWDEEEDDEEDWQTAKKTPTQRHESEGGFQMGKGKKKRTEKKKGK